jgi:hypothetical protein
MTTVLIGSILIPGGDSAPYQTPRRVLAAEGSGYWLIPVEFDWKDGSTKGDCALANFNVPTSGSHRMTSSTSGSEDQTKIRARLSKYGTGPMKPLHHISRTRHRQRPYRRVVTPRGSGRQHKQAHIRKPFFTTHFTGSGRGA